MSSLFKKLVLFLGDVGLLYLSLASTLFIRYAGVDFTSRWEAHLIPFSIIFILWILVFYLFNLYQYKTSRAPELLKTVVYAVVTSGFLSVTAFYLFPDTFGLTPKTNLALFAFIFLMLSYSWHRLIVFTVFSSGAEKIIILGDSPLIQQTIKHIEAHPHIGYRIAEWIKNVISIDPGTIREAITKHNVHHLVIQNHLEQGTPSTRLIYKLLAHEINVTDFWHFYENVFEKIPLEELREGWFVENISAHRPLYEKVKRIVDIFFSAILFVVLLPLMLLSAILIKLSSTGPILYAAERAGRNNKPFTLYKFRTMRENHSGPLWTEKNDARVTPIGKFLRITHLDELPQLVNVLRGNISFIGPRPERVELAEQFKDLPYYDIRHIVKPGITGWAQVNYRPSASLEEAREKLRYDIYYIKHRSLLLDLVILIRTIRYFFTAPHE